MGWTGFRFKVKFDFFRLLTLKIVLIFLSLSIARMLGVEVDDMIYSSWTNVTVAMLPASSIKEGADHYSYNRSNGSSNKDIYGKEVDA